MFYEEISRFSSSFLQEIVSAVIFLRHETPVCVYMWRLGVVSIEKWKIIKADLKMTLYDIAIIVPTC